MEDQNKNQDESILNSNEEEKRNESVDQNVKKGKKDKSKVIIIVCIIIAIIATLSVGGFFVVRNFVAQEDIEKEDSTGADWGDSYNKYLESMLKESVENLEQKFGINEKINNAKVMFLNLKDSEKNTMIIKYKEEENEAVNIYQIANNDKIVYTKYKTNSPKLVQMYNVETKEYNWYIKTVEDDGTSITDVKDIVDALKKEEENESIESSLIEVSQQFKDEKDENDIEEKLSEFDRKYIEIENEEVNSFDFNLNDDPKSVKEHIKNIVANYKDVRANLNDEIKSTVETKETEIKTKVEEESKGIKVGDKFAEYGLYIGAEGYDATADGYIIINNDRTAEVNYLTTDSTGKYVVKNVKCRATVRNCDFSQDSSSSIVKPAITLYIDQNGNGKFDNEPVERNYMVYENNSLSDGDIEAYVHVDMSKLDEIKNKLNSRVEEENKKKAEYEAKKKAEEEAKAKAAEEARKKAEEASKQASNTNGISMSEAIRIVQNGYKLARVATSAPKVKDSNGNWYYAVDVYAQIDGGDGRYVYGATCFVKLDGSGYYQGCYYPVGGLSNGATVSNSDLGTWQKIY